MAILIRQPGRGNEFRQSCRNGSTVLQLTRTSGTVRPARTYSALCSRALLPATARLLARKPGFRGEGKKPDEYDDQNQHDQKTAEFRRTVVTGRLLIRMIHRIGLIVRVWLIHVELPCELTA